MFYTLLLTTPAAYFRSVLGLATSERGRRHRLHPSRKVRDLRGALRTHSHIGVAMPSGIVALPSGPIFSCLIQPSTSRAYDLVQHCELFFEVLPAFSRDPVRLPARSRFDSSNPPTLV